MEQLTGQDCSFCHKKTLTLSEDKKEIPYFGNVYIFSMTCSNCKFHKSDVEAEDHKDPCKITYTIEKEKDMKIRVVKSSTATVKIPQMRLSVTPGPASIGYISNIEGVLKKFEDIIEQQRDNAEENSDKKSAKNLLKKMRKVKLGDVSVKLVIEDPSGNSAIISEKTVIEKLKVKK